MDVGAAAMRSAQPYAILVNPQQVTDYLRVERQDDYSKHCRSFDLRNARPDWH